MPAGLLVTVPVPMPAVAAVRVNGPELPPIRLTCCALQTPSSLMVRVPFLLPVACGVKVRSMVQLAPESKLAPHAFFDMANSPLFVPPIDTLVMFKILASPLSNVAVSSPLLVPVDSIPKLRLVGVRLISVWQPDRFTTCGFKGPPLEGATLAAPVVLPSERGLKIN